MAGNGALLPCYRREIAHRAGERRKETSKAFYEVYVPRDFVIGYHSVFKRLSDGRVFRVTSNPQDKQTPMGATFSFAYVTAEEWRIPNDKK